VPVPPTLPRNTGQPTQLDKIINNTLNPRTLEGAYRELRGEVTQFKADGKPYDHVSKVHQALNGLRNYERSLDRQVSTASRNGDLIEISKNMSEISRVNTTITKVERYVNNANQEPLP
jgi:hypothetical protein